MRVGLGVLIVIALARPLAACECASVMRQLLLDQAQFAAEVSAVGGGEFVVGRVIRGRRSASGGSFRVPRGTVVQTGDCCDRRPKTIVDGKSYWAIAPEQPVAAGKHLEIDDVRILIHDDPSITWLSHVHDLTPEQLRATLQRWKAGAIPPYEFSEYINAVDVPGVSACIRGYYHRLLMDVTFMAWGNQDHARCAMDEASRVRTQSATAALAALSFIQNEGQAGRLVCARDVKTVAFMPELVDRQVRQTGFLYPCIDTRNKKAISDDEAEVVKIVLRSYVDEVLGIGSKQHLLLYYRSVNPARDQLEVGVFSPANEEPEKQYASPQVKKLIEDLRTRNARTVMISPPSQQFAETSTHAIDCIDERSMFDNVIAVSRPGFDGRKTALVYLEYPGGARAYHLVREDSHWTVDWDVELWQCG